MCIFSLDKDRNYVEVRKIVNEVKDVFKKYKKSNPSSFFRFPSNSLCATSSRKPGKDYYTGSDTVKFLASGVPDRVFSQLTDLAYTQVLKVH